MSEADKVIRQLNVEIDTDLSTFVTQYVATLRQTTPIKSGRARNGWQQTYQKGNVGKGKPIPIAKNNVPYIGILDEGSSRQAPQGIVKPSLLKTRKN